MGDARSPRDANDRHGCRKLHRLQVPHLPIPIMIPSWLIQSVVHFGWTFNHILFGGRFFPGQGLPTGIFSYGLPLMSHNRRCGNCSNHVDLRSAQPSLRFCRVHPGTATHEVIDEIKWYLLCQGPSKLLLLKFVCKYNCRFLTSSERRLWSAVRAFVHNLPTSLRPNCVRREKGLCYFVGIEVSDSRIFPLGRTNQLLNLLV